MIDKKVIVSAGIGALVALFGFIVLAQLSDKMKEDSRKKRAAVIMDFFEKNQARLGVQCVDADAVLLRYGNAAGQVTGRMSNRKQLSLSDPIIEQGERTAEILQTCELQSIDLKSIDNNMLSGMAFNDNAVMDDFYVIRLALTTATVSTCNPECVVDARRKADSSLQRLRQRLEPRKAG